MIKSITIKNFKSITELKVNCNEKFNVIIGENNIGKTTIFEAIHLWKMCYDWNTKKDKKGFYSRAKNIPFKDMEFLRAYTDNDIFPVGCSVKNAVSYISMVLYLEEEEFDLGFSISKVSSIDNSYYQVEYMQPGEFEGFATKVQSMHNFNLANIIVINESRPIANIVVKEPYMYRAQVLEKISKGKGYEVLRNKITKSAGHMQKVQAHLRNVMEQEFQLSEIDKDNKTYIRLHVNGTDILSQGSGFLQIAEIFSSLEYTEAAIYILLIDEPDSHIHVKLQKKLIDELRTIHNSQLFVITHNERFLADIDESEIRFINHDAKNGAPVDALARGCKGIVVENLVGVLNNIQVLRYANKILLLEGKTDKEFFDKFIPIYEQITGSHLHNIYIDKMDGIDTLNNKLLVYTRALKEIVPDTCEWIVLRDSDCVPISRQQDVRTNHFGFMRVPNKKIYFQNGYGIESTFVAEPEKLARLLAKYYNIDLTECSYITNLLENQNQNYATKVLMTTDSLNEELEEHFNRQKRERKEPIYDSLSYRDMLAEINQTSIQYIMTKKIINIYLSDIHNTLGNQYNLTKERLTDKTIFEEYYVQINTIEDVFEAHKELMRYLD